MESIGGQAVIEGVMIKSKKWIVTAVRKSNGKIVFERKKNDSLTKKRFWKLPLIRGIILLFETLIEGYRAIDYSARESAKEQGTAKISTFQLVISLILAIAVALVLFKLIPLAAVQLLNIKFTVFNNRFIFNLTEGLLKIILLIAYIYSISLMADIKRIFQYHGAEHKAVNCYEKEKSFNPNKAKDHSTIHIRCGTNFLFLFLVISILIYTMLPIDLPFLTKYLWRIALLPIIGGVSYELIKLSSIYPKNLFLKLLIWPGIFMQRITTKEPDAKQLQVALFAVKKSV